tara:strand:+ start:2811 stop:3215 length:405 start_codon:yes stop_codon:yes gene_type:complete
MKPHALILLLLSACGGAEALDASAVVEQDSNAANFVLSVRHTPAVMPLNAEFEVRFQLLDMEGRALDVEVEDVSVDADMPEHGHGMTVFPSVRREGSEYVAGPMLFHMSGRWEVYVDVRRGAVTERAQVAWTLD